MNTFYARTLIEWHDWLLEHAVTEQEIWLVFYKKSSGMLGISLAEAIDEALCFGWVDSLIKNVDAVSHVRKFTPRKAGSQWSELNIARARRLIAAGRMTEAGQRLFQESNEHHAQSGQSRKDHMETWRKELIPMLTPDVRALFEGLSPSHQRQYAGWVMSGKRLETRENRIRELSSVLVNGEELGLK
jgi:uncharacterized protein YdeI (YjbR/CyaY-like superfamily)